jgi:predicted nucleotide-binding protein
MTQTLFNLPYQPATSIAFKQSLASSFTFNGPQQLSNLGNITYSIVVTPSNSTGNFTVQGSNDGSTFNDIPLGIASFTTVPIPSGGSVTVPSSLQAIPTVSATNDTITLILVGLPYLYTQLNYTSIIPGTGTCTISVIQ